MDLEIADYERTVQTLNAAVDDKDEKVKECEIEIVRQQENVTSLQKQLGQ